MKYTSNTVGFFFVSSLV